MNNNLEFIKGIVNEEKADISLYIKESELFKEKIIGGEKISKTFNHFASDENKHIEILINLFKIKNPEQRIIMPYSSLRKNLRLHLIREQESIFLYQKLIKSLDDDEKAKKISEIIKDEEYHLKIIKRYLFLII